MRVNRLVAAATAALLVAALSACNSGTKPVADESPAPSTSAPAEPESESASPEDSPQADGEDVDPAALLDDMKAAVADQQSAHLTMKMDSGAQGMSGEGDISYAGDTTAMQMTMTAPQLGAGEIEMRLIDGVVYMSMPPMIPKGKFIKLDTNDPNSPLGDLGGITAGDPLQSFDAFDAGLKKVKYVGKEDVEGEQLRHYVLTVDGDKAAKAEGQDAPQGMSGMLTYDLWLDDHDLMRRMEFDQMGGGVTMTMSNWGDRVTVRPPPAGAIMKMPGLAG